MMPKVRLVSYHLDNLLSKGVEQCQVGQVCITFVIFIDPPCPLYLKIVLFSDDHGSANPLLPLSPPPCAKDFTYNLEDSEGLSDLFEASKLDN